MGIFIRKYKVFPNKRGILFNRLKEPRFLEPGIYKSFDPFRNDFFISLPINKRLMTITNQEVLSSDNIALRFSFSLIYQLLDFEKIMENFDIDLKEYAVIAQIEQRLHNFSQIELRNIIAAVSSEELNSKRDSLFKNTLETIREKTKELGVEILDISLRDISFPKMIQEVFTQELEAKIRARVDLTNARTQVATARTLKNAASLMNENEDIRFLHYLETINKIAAKGKHTFVIGNPDDLGK